MSITNPIIDAKPALKVRCAASTPAEIYGPPLPPIPNAETIAAMKEGFCDDLPSANSIEELETMLDADD